MNFEKNFQNLKDQALGKAAKMISAFMIAGIVVLGQGTEAFENLKISSSPEKYIEYAQKSCDDELKVEMMREKLNYLEDEFSPYVITYLVMSHEALIENKEEMPAKPVVVGFESLGIEKEDLENLWSDRFYPRGAVEGNVSRIEYEGNQSAGVGDYNIKGRAAAGTKDFEDRIIFHDNEIGINSKEELKDKIESLDWNFSHELGHKTDWINGKLSPLEKVDFLCDVAKLFNKPGSFRDPLGYINSINHDNKQKEKYYKVREYWASLCEQYLTFPEMAGDYLSKDEIGLVKKWLEKEDKSFDPIKASKKKSLLFKKMVKNKFPE